MSFPDVYWLYRLVQQRNPEKFFRRERPYRLCRLEGERGGKQGELGQQLWRRPLAHVAVWQAGDLPYKRFGSLGFHRGAMPT